VTAIAICQPPLSLLRGVAGDFGASSENGNASWSGRPYCPARSSIFSSSHSGRVMTQAVNMTDLGLGRVISLRRGYRRAATGRDALQGDGFEHIFAISV
jgi:hypothetical protein